ncbi:MAG: penicillin acylase family protein [Acidobacteriota bacterium]
MNAAPSKRPRRRWWRLLGRAAAAALVLLLLVSAVAVIWGSRAWRSGLPRLEGAVSAPGLKAPATIDRDAIGVPAIRAASRLDAAYATGFVHAQDRFFQMDLLRRRAAGEIAEVLGPPVAWVDVAVRRHRFAARAERQWERAPVEERRLLEAYAAGVAAGLDDLGTPPFEHALLGVEPRPWRPADSYLVVFAMYLDLDDAEGWLDRGRGRIRSLLAEPLADFLLAAGEVDSAALDGSRFPEPPLPGTAPPGVRPEAESEAADAGMRDLEVAQRAASNALALGGSHTADGRALLAADVHLALGLPNIWYRLALHWPDGPDGERRLVGATLPGLPLVVVGSNGRLAWGVTNAYADTTDVVRLEPGNEPDSYLTSRGPQRWRRVVETVRVRGGRDREVEVIETSWGPLLDAGPEGDLLALRWDAHAPGAAGLDWRRLEEADDVSAGLAVAAAAAGPALNMLLADAAGAVGWTVAGRLESRASAEVPVDGAQLAPAAWNFLPPLRKPRLAPGPDGRLWSANHRHLSGEGLASLGDGGYSSGTRAAQLRDGLRALPSPAGEQDLLALMLDDRAWRLDRWQALLADTLAASDDPALAAAHRHVVDWGGRAAIDSVGYRLVRNFRRRIAIEVLDSLLGPVVAEDPGFPSGGVIPRHELPLWRVISERPEHLVPAGRESWEALFEGTARAAVDELSRGPQGLDGATWGRRNTVQLRHPLSQFLPPARRWLDLPPRQLPGDSFVPRVQHPTFGSSLRIVVAPGREERGLFHMPGGAGGHPATASYGAGHETWELGLPTPLLPGPAVHRIELIPDPAESPRPGAASGSDSNTPASAGAVSIN